MTEIKDLQEKYRERNGELNPSVPLAADAAHLLTEYLDTMAVEFVRHGIPEPYRITRQYEEIFVQELQNLGKKGKLTYEVTSEMLDRYGQPQEVVRDYIAEHDLQAQEILARPKIREKTPAGTEPSAIARITSNSLRDNVKIALVVMVFAFTIGYEIVTLRFAVSDYFDEFLPVAPVFLFPFAVMEIIVGLRGPPVRKKYYLVGREVSRFLLSTIVIVTTLFVLDQHKQHIEWILGVIIPTWLAIYGIGAIADHTDILQSLTPQEKPIARFFLPSYLTLYLAYAVAAVMFLVESDRQYGIFNQFSVYINFIFVIGAISLLLDFRRKYPLSIKKIGYTLVLAIVPVYAFSYNVASYPWRFEMRYFPVYIMTYVLLWLFICAVIIPLLFRSEISEQLSRYRLQLDDYRL